MYNFIDTAAHHEIRHHFLSFATVLSGNDPEMIMPIEIFIPTLDNKSVKCEKNIYFYIRIGFSYRNNATLDLMCYTTHNGHPFLLFGVLGIYRIGYGLPLITIVLVSWEAICQWFSRMIATYADILRIASQVTTKLLSTVIHLQDFDALKKQSLKLSINPLFRRCHQERSTVYLWRHSNVGYLCCDHWFIFKHWPETAIF